MPEIIILAASREKIHYIKGYKMKKHLRHDPDCLIALEVFVCHHLGDLLVGVAKPF